MTGQDVFVKRRVFYPANVFLCVLGHNKQHVSSFNYGKIRTTRAVLVAISIPIFTSQLEKSKEAVDAANLRAAYAEVMSDYVTGKTDTTKEVVQKQTKAGWSTTFDFPAGFTVNVPKDNNGKWTVKMNSAGTSTEATN